MQHEIELWVAAGIPVEVALQAATLNAAKLLRADARIGTIEKGKEATLLLVDGNPLHACVAPLSAVAGRSVTTLEGMKDGNKPSRLQQAFIDEQAAQCGYCTSGMIVRAQALLNSNPQPTDAEVRSALDGNLCRCGAHNRIVRAVLRVAKGA